MPKEGEGAQGAGQTGDAGSGGGGGWLDSPVVGQDAGEGTAVAEGEGEQTPPAEGAETGEGNPPTGEQLPRLYAGRFGKVEELETAYGESSREGMRLYTRTRDLEQGTLARDARIAELEEDIKLARSQPTFREMSAEELKALAQSDPVAATEYVAEKKLRERDAQTAKERAKTEREAKTREHKRIADLIDRRTDEMIRDTKRYPGYAKLQSVMEDFMDKTNDALAGHEWTPDALYLMAKGFEAVQAERKAGTDTDRSRQDAAGKASADARMSGTVGAGGRQQPPRPQGSIDPASGISDEDWNKRLIAAGPRKLFG